MKITPQGFAVLDDDRDGLLSRWIEEHKVLCVEGAVRSHYVPQIPVGGVVVDAGAALGDHTTAYLDKVGMNGHVWAFEPNREMFECLKHNCPRASSFNLALGQSHCERRMFHIKENAGASYLVDSGGDYEVEVMPLDDLALDRLDFFKLDVEGMELQALKGAVETIKRCRPVIVMECNPPFLKRSGTTPVELRQYLTDLGYCVQILLGTEDNEHYELIGRPV